MSWKLQERIDQLLPRNSFVRGVLALSGGTIGAQAVLLAVSPLLTRLYTPEMFGVAAVFVGVSTVLGTLATWRYEIAIPQADDDQAAASIAVLCLVLTLAMFAFGSVIVLLLREEIVRLFQMKAVAGFLWLIPFFILSMGLYQLLTYWGYRQRQFGKVAQSSVGKNLGMAGVQLLLYPFGAVSLLMGQLMGQFLASLLLLKNTALLFKQKVTRQHMRHNAWRFRKYPLFSSWSGVTGSAAQQAPILMFAALFSPVQAGLYSLANRIVGMPGALVGTAVSNVFLPHAADAWREGRMGELLIEVHQVLTRLAMPAVVVLLLLAPSLFSVVFGSEWREAGYYAQWLTVMLYANFIYSPVSTSFGIMDRQDAGLLLHIGLLSVSVVSIWIGASVYHNTLVTVAFYSVANAVLYLLALVWLHLKAGSTLVALLKPLAASLWRALPMTLPLLLIASFALPPWSVCVLGVTAAFFTFLYYLPLLGQLRQQTKGQEGT